MQSLSLLAQMLIAHLRVNMAGGHYGTEHLETRLKPQALLIVPTGGNIHYAPQ